MRKCRVRFVLAFLATATTLFSQVSYSPSDHFIAMGVGPSFRVAFSNLGSALDIGGEARLIAPIPALRGLGLGLIAGYSTAPEGPRSLAFSETRVGAIVQYSLPLANRLWIEPAIGGGVFVALLDMPAPYLDTLHARAFVIAAGSILLRLNQWLGICAGGQWSFIPGEYSTLGGFVSANIFMGSRQRRQAEGQQRLQQLEGGIRDAPDDRVGVDGITLDPLYPVLFSHYKNSPLGSARVRNKGDKALSDVSVEVSIPEFMKSPRSIAVTGSLSPGDSASFDITLLLEDTILTVVEAKPVTMDVATVFTREGIRFRARQVVPVSVQRRNALTWDDDRKICAFVTAADTLILEVARKVAGMVSRTANAPFDRSLLVAMAMHEAINAMGVRYVPDPFTPYEDLSRSATAIDFLQFPRQTLQFAAGDCDDLSALYAALLEAVGVETAFITVPGHILPAFALELPAPEAARLLRVRGSELIVRDGKAWVPVESTVRDESFLKAWDQGARQWSQYGSTGEAGFFSTRSGWEAYGPADAARIDSTVQLQSIDEIERRFHRTLERFVASESEPTIRHYETLLEKNRNDSKALTNLGVTYARYGRYDEADRMFKRVLEVSGEGNYPAQVNLGNLLFIREEYEQALERFQRAHALDGEGASALLGIARSLYALDDVAGSRAAHQKLSQIDPEMAKRYAYLGIELNPATRGGNVVAGGGPVVWEEVPEQ